MSMPSRTLRMVEVSGAEAMWLLEGAELGRLVFTQREVTVVRPARHVWEYGRLVARTPVQPAAVPLTATYQADDVQAAAGTGWTVSATGPAEVITDPHEAAHYRRTLSGWTHGPHDTVVRIHPQTLTGFRLVRGTERS
ncbi:pyridoxamine 5'-phosphate oxidase family protein [Streptomyces sp. L2]|uniref:pyridoxamine 5'-phosphate oxidase family protein n=1 Tax=Streptomyces sp. L2 TaxID=2162665 RepID=UPI001011C0F0|nr:pyridoxamine 5'-phosphate oxidase family protein [Streptomyces sp. L2]